MAKLPNVEGPPRATEGWCKMLGEGIDLGTEREVQIQEMASDDGTPKKSDATFWRARKPEHANLPAATKAWLQVNEKVPGARVPPPYILIDERDDWEWIDLGERLRLGAPEQFEEVLETVKKIVNGSDALRNLKGMGYGGGSD